MRTTTILIAAAVMLAAACGKTAEKKKSPEEEGPGAFEVASGSGQPGAGSSGSGSSGAGSGSSAATATCDDPCLLLKDGDLAAARTACPDWSLGKDPAACDDLDYTRNCVYAAYGYTFKKDRWKKAFGDKPWYRPDPAFKEATMSRAATANVAELKQLAAACRAHNEDQISPKTREVVEAWFVARAKGVPPLPDKVTDFDGQPITKAEFIKNFLGKDSHLFFKDKWEPLEWVEKRGKAEVVSVYTSAGDPSVPCPGEGEDCEGFEGIEFTVEGDAIVAIKTFAAACPFVYQLDAAGAWRYQGEALRNLASPAAETTQPLALSATCSATRTLRVTEEKHEVTYLDSVALSIDGALLLPTLCPSASPLCADDGTYLALATGDSIDLTFTLPAPSCSPATLLANGHYLGTESRSSTAP